MQNLVHKVHKVRKVYKVSIIQHPVSSIQYQALVIINSFLCRFKNNPDICTLNFNRLIIIN
jgi:hypothetical protein